MDKQKVKIKVYGNNVYIYECPEDIEVEVINYNDQESPKYLN
ncbi:MAG: hypothetical protein BWY74_00021 [Firmicutes bacterium ADurb.Bin419]|nr:MAG: hypothetical protein BWY74_00021 [Firmicutes bacterium ADurb.Bin419]